MRWPRRDTFWLDWWERADRFDKPMLLPERGPATANAAVPPRIIVDEDTYVIRSDLPGGNCRTFVAARTAVPVGLESFPRVPA
jgi:hypothetical protein